MLFQEIGDEAGVAIASAPMAPRAFSLAIPRKAGTR